MDVNNQAMDSPSFRIWRALRVGVSLTRSYMSFLIGISSYVGYAISGGAAPKVALAVFLAEFAIASSGFAMNDVLDRSRDVGQAHKPIAAGRCSLRAATAIAVVFALLGIWSAAFVGPVPATLCVSQLVVLAVYSKAKSLSGILGNLVTALLCASAFLVGALAGELQFSVAVAGALTLTVVLGREIVKDIVDMNSDARAGIRSLPLLYGRRASALTVSGLVAVAVGVSIHPFAIASFSSAYVWLIAIADGALVVAALRLLARPESRAREFLLVSALSFPVALVGFYIGRI